MGLRMGYLTFRLILLSGDVESNPGPIGRNKESKPDKNKIMQDKVDEHDTKLTELAEKCEKQSEMIETMRSEQSDLKKKVESFEEMLSEKLTDSKKEWSEKLQCLENKFQKDCNDRVNELQYQLGEDIGGIQTEHLEFECKIKNEISDVASRLSGVDTLSSNTEGTANKLDEMQNEIEDILEKLWELDKSWKNNLVFYGIKCEQGTDEHPSVTENKVREIIRKNMQITRDIGIIRVKRDSNGPMVRGCQPVTVYFEKWQDKEEIMRKTKVLRGSNIFVAEDFSKRVKEQRQELHKFMRVMRKKKPEAKFSLQYDKLLIDKDVFMYNELSGEVEPVYQVTMDGNVVMGQQTPMPTPIKQQPGARGTVKSAKPNSAGRISKSYSAESSLNHIVPSSAEIHHQLQQDQRNAPENSRDASDMPSSSVLTDSVVSDESGSNSTCSTDGSSVLAQQNVVGCIKKNGSLNPGIPETIPEVD